MQVTCEWICRQTQSYQVKRGNRFKSEGLEDLGGKNVWPGAKKSLARSSLGGRSVELSVTGREHSPEASTTENKRLRLL